MKTQNNTIIELSKPNPEKNFLKISEPKPKRKKHPNFPARNKGKTRPTKILPSHRLIYQNYKDQGFRHLGKAIRKTDVYSEGVAQRVSQITKSKSWQALLEEEMPDELLTQRHNELLNKRDYRKVTNQDGTVTEVDDGPNAAAVTKSLEMAYKLKGAFKDKEAESPSTVTYNLFYKPEVREQMKNFEEGIKQTLFNEVARKNQKDIEQEESNRAELERGGPEESGEDPTEAGEG